MKPKTNMIELCWGLEGRHVHVRDEIDQICHFFCEFLEFPWILSDPIQLHRRIIQKIHDSEIYFFDLSVCKHFSAHSEKKNILPKYQVFFQK